LILLGISGADSLRDLPKDQFTVKWDDKNEVLSKPFSKPVMLADWGKMGSASFRELSQALSQSERGLQSGSLQQVRDYNGVVELARSVVAEEDGALIVLETPPLLGSGGVVSGELSWGDNAATPILFQFDLVGPQSGFDFSAEATTAQGVPEGPVGGGFLIKVELPESFPITYSLSKLAITFGGVEGRVVQLDKSNSQGTTVRAMVPAREQPGEVTVLVWNTGIDEYKARFTFEYIDDRIPEILQVLPVRMYADDSREIRIVITNLDVELVGADDVQIDMKDKQRDRWIGSPPVDSLDSVGNPNDGKAKITFHSIPLGDPDPEHDVTIVEVTVAFGGRESVFEVSYVTAPSGSPIITSVVPPAGICTDGSVKVKLRLTGMRMIRDAAELQVSVHGNLISNDGKWQQDAFANRSRGIWLH